MSWDELAYRRGWAKQHRTPLQQAEHEVRMLELGKCPICEILLSSRYHTDCPWLIHMHNLLDNGQGASTM